MAEENEAVGGVSGVTTALLWKRTQWHRGKWGGHVVLPFNMACSFYEPSFKQFDVQLGAVFGEVSTADWCFPLIARSHRLKDHAQQKSLCISLQLCKLKTLYSKLHLA